MIPSAATAGTTGCMFYDFGIPAFAVLSRASAPICLPIVSKIVPKDCQSTFSHADFTSLNIYMSCSYVLNNVHDIDYVNRCELENVPACRIRALTLV